MGILELMTTPPDGAESDVDLFDRKAGRLSGRSVGNPAQPTDGPARNGPERPALAVAGEGAADAHLLARLAAIEDRLDRHSMAFGALCELVCEPLGITEADLARSIRRIAAEY
jgi:hypothetical protein